MKEIASVLALARQCIRNLEPYSTARDEYSGGEIGIFLDANESPYDNGLNRYPDPHQKLLKDRISSLKGIPVANLFLGNGSDEVIDLCYRVFCTPGQDNAIVIAPSYGMYGVAAGMNDVELRTVQLKEDYSLDTEAILRAADSRSKLLFLCSPNNPTGNSFPASEILSLADRFPGIVVLDEAYIDFSSSASLSGKISEYPNLIIMQTLSKAWGLAGLRIGLAIAAPEIVGLFSKVKYPYNINGPAQKTALDMISPQIKEAHVKEILSERARVIEAASASPVVRKVFPTDANFILMRVDDPDGLYKILTDNGIIVRNRSRVKGCEGCLRVTIGTPAENDRLISILKDPLSPEALPPVFIPGERHVVISRETKETKVKVDLNLDGQGGNCSIDTGLKFFDHMLEQIPHHGGISLDIRADGDLEVDEHHTVEDVGIVLGEAIFRALGSKAGIERYGFVLPMDECEAMVLIDLGGRIDFKWDVEFTREYVGDVPTEMFRHFFQSVCNGAKCNLHIKATGENNHHKAEAVFKAFARALRMAVSRSRFPYELPSSKGLL